MKLAWIPRSLLTALLALFVPAAHAAEDAIEVGILHSLSGTMAISESALKDTVLMLIADQNKKGGLLGRKLQPVVVDPASNWDAFTEKAYELLVKEKVAASWNVTVEALASKKRTKDVTVPRQVAMYLIRELLDLPLVEIGRQFGGRDHSTVIHSIAKVEDDLKTNAELGEKVSTLRAQLQGGAR